MNIKKYLHQEYTIKRRTQSDIAKEQDLPVDVIEYLIKKSNLLYSRTKIKFLLNESKIDDTNPIFMYYVGLIATDGYINIANNRVCLRLKDINSREMFDMLIKYFEYQGPLFKYGSYLEFRITSKLLIEKLISLGLTETNKTFVLDTPKNFHNEDCMKMYIRGVHDGDGNVKRKLDLKTNKWKGGSWRLLTGSHIFIENMCKILNSHFNFELKKRINSRKNNKEYPEIITKEKEGKILLSWIYEGYEKYRLEDKYQKYLSIS